MITTQTQSKSASQSDRLPVIEEIFDSVTGRRDGRIIPCSPVLFTGRNLLYWSEKKVWFNVSPVTNPGRMIPVDRVYRYENNKILVQVPFLEEGEYRLVARITDKENCESSYSFPKIIEVRDMSVAEIIQVRNERKL